MKRTLKFRKNGKPRKVKMEVCSNCGIGVGVTDYPGGKFKHQYDKLIDGLCPDCYKEMRRLYKS